MILFRGCLAGTESAEDSARALIIGARSSQMQALPRAATDFLEQRFAIIDRTLATMRAETSKIGFIMGHGYACHSLIPV